MAKKKTETKEEALAAQPPKVNVAMTTTGLMPTNIDDGFRFAKMISRSRMVPENYQNNPDNCLVAIDLSLRWGVSWLAVMQNVYMVHDSPALEAKLVIALVNKSNLFVDPLDYEVEGDDPYKAPYRVRAVAVRQANGKKLEGPWISWQLVKAEKWDQPKKGFPSKWLTMPEQMFYYRAASWFANRHCPEVKMGMLTTDEAHDAGPKHVESSVVEKGVQALKDRLQEREEATEPKGDELDADRAAEVKRQKAALREAEEQDEQEQPDDEAPKTEEKPAAKVDDTASIFD